MNTYTIGQAAERAGLSADTLRYYDKQGLLPFVARAENGYRVFTEEDFAGALKMLQEKRIPATEIVSRILPLEETTETSEELVKGASRDIKVLVDVNG